MWQPIETAPSEGQIVFAVWPDGGIDKAVYYEGDFWFQSTRERRLCNKVGFTHWMPLPLPPEGEGK